MLKVLGMGWGEERAMTEYEILRATAMAYGIIWVGGMLTLFVGVGFTFFALL